MVDKDDNPPSAAAGGSVVLDQGVSYKVLAAQSGKERHLADDSVEAKDLEGVEALFTRAMATFGGKAAQVCAPS